MPETILLVTYNGLDVTELEAQSIIGDVYKNARDVVDAVEGLSGGKKMEDGIIYHFNGMGISAMVSPPKPIPATEVPREHWGTEGDAIEIATTIVRPEAVTDSPLKVLAAHVSVSSVCESEEIISAARQEGNAGNAEFPPPPNETDWNLTRINAGGDAAKKYSGKGIKIAILDTGIAYHDDLDENVKGGESFCEGDTDFRNDSFGHGTHCAGIVAGNKGGIAKAAHLFSVKVANEKKRRPVAILSGLGWALRNRMNVVAISLAGSADLKHIPAFANAVQALMRINCVVVASTGNSDTGTNGEVGLPANTPGIIAVGGCDEKGVILTDTRIGGKGNHMTVVAPATNITAPSPHVRDGYVWFGGSSAAAPHVAGLVALIQNKFPGITPLQVIGRILASAQPVDIRRGQMTVRFGDVLIDCEAALSLY